MMGLHGHSQKKKIMTEAISMVKFSSYRYLAAAFLLSPFKKETTETKKKMTEAKASVCLILASSPVLSINSGRLTAVFQKRVVKCLLYIV